MTNYIIIIKCAGNHTLINQCFWISFHQMVGVQPKKKEEDELISLMWGLGVYVWIWGKTIENWSGNG